MCSCVKRPRAISVSYTHLDVYKRQAKGERGDGQPDGRPEWIGRHFDMTGVTYRFQWPLHIDDGRFFCSCVELIRCV